MSREKWTQTSHLKVLSIKILDTFWLTRLAHLAATSQRGWTAMGLTSVLIGTWAGRMRWSKLGVFITMLLPSSSFICLLCVFSSLFIVIIFLWRTSFKRLALNFSFGYAGPNTADSSLPHWALGCCRCAGKIMSRKRLQCKEVWMDPDSGNKQTAPCTHDLFQLLISLFIPSTNTLAISMPFSEMGFHLKWSTWLIEKFHFWITVCSEQRLWCCWGGRKQPAAASVPVCCLHKHQKTAHRAWKRLPLQLTISASICEESAAGGRWGRDEEEERETMVTLHLQELTQTIEDVFMWVEGCH